MSSDEAFVLAVLAALKTVGLEAIVVGNVAAILQGAPVTTQDIDLLVRDTSKEAAGRPKDRAQLAALRDALRVKNALEAPAKPKRR